MALLDREALLKKQELKITKVDLGEDFVYVRQMTGRDRDAFERSLWVKRFDKNGRPDGFEQDLLDFRAKLAVRTLCDEEGTLLLKAEDIPILSQNMTAKNLDLIVSEAQKLNGISEADKENLVKNSGAGQVEDSHSD